MVMTVAGPPLTKFAGHAQPQHTIPGRVVGDWSGACRTWHRSVETRWPSMTDRHHHQYDPPALAPLRARVADTHAHPHTPPEIFAAPQVSLLVCSDAQRQACVSACAPVILYAPHRYSLCTSMINRCAKPHVMAGALDAGDVARIFKAMAGKAGLTAEEAARISGHSTRIGASQDMVRYGAELPAIMQAGRCATPVMVARYTRRLTARRRRGADRRSAGTILTA